MKAKAIFNIIVAVTVTLYAIVSATVIGISIGQSEHSAKIIFSSSPRILFSIVFLLLYIFMIFSSVKLLRARPDNLERPKLEKVVRIQFVAATFIVLAFLYSRFGSRVFPQDLELAFPLAIFYILPFFILKFIALVFLIRSVIVSRKKNYP